MPVGGVTDILRSGAPEGGVLDEPPAPFTPSASGLGEEAGATTGVSSWEVEGTLSVGIDVGLFVATSWSELLVADGEDTAVLGVAAVPASGVVEVPCSS